MQTSCEIMTPNNVGQRHPLRRRRRQTPSCLMLTAAAVLAVSSVSALQPHRQPIMPNNKATTRKTSTTLDYVATPETTAVTDVTTTTTSSSTSQTLKDLEKLLRVELELSLDQTKRPVEIGVTMASITHTLPQRPHTSTRTPVPALKQEAKSPRRMPSRNSRATTVAATATKKRTMVNKKRVTVVAAQQAKQRKVVKAVSLSGSATATTRTRARTSAAASTTASRLSTTAKRRQIATLPTPRAPTKRTKDQVYWLRRPSNPSERTKLLTREEEIELTQQIRALRTAEQVRDDHMMNHQNDLTESEWASACAFANPLELRRVVRLGQEARARVVQANMGLVTSIAKRQQSSLKLATEAGNGVGTILTLQDCLQEGQIGLITAAERFDASRNVRFSTYATWWIRQRILRSISDSSRIIRLPAYVHSMLMKIRKAKHQMHQEIGREPSAPELAHYMEMTVAKLQQYTQSSRNVVSLENPLRPTNSGKGDLDFRTLADTIASDAPTPLEDAQRLALRQDLNQLLNDALTSDERTVLLARYGLEDGHSKTLEETSRQLGVSREKIRLVETRALNKLRSPQKNYRLKTYLGGSLNTGKETRRNKDKTVSTASQKAPWMTNNSLRNSVSGVADTINPFASPFDYATSRSSRSSQQSKETRSSNVKDAESQTAAPDRMWFF